MLNKRLWDHICRTIGCFELSLAEERTHVEYLLEQANMAYDSALRDYLVAHAAIYGLSFSPCLSFLYIKKSESGVQVSVTYKGALQLAYASGEVVQLKAWAVRDGDISQVAAESDSWPAFSAKSFDPKRGKIKGGLASAKMITGQIHHFPISEEDLQKIAELGSEVWRGAFVDEMVKKQAIWRALRQLPSVYTSREQAGSEILRALKSRVTTWSTNKITRATSKQVGKVSEEPAFLALL